MSSSDNSPLVHGYPVVPETECEGWYYGTITEFIEPAGCENGDGYVVAPDGTCAGLVWEVGEGDFTEILPPDEQRWGVYAVWFPRPIKTLEDLVFNFRFILPELQNAYARAGNL